MLSIENKFLEDAFIILNKVYFDCCLPAVVITIQSSPKAHGYITTQKVWQDKENSYYEINIGAESLNRPVENIIATLLHEMVHLYCMENNISDTSKNGKYHNKRFKVEAEKRDLEISYGQYIGYSVTAPSDKFVQILKENNLLGEIIHYRNAKIELTNGGSGIGAKGIDGIKRKSSTRKYVCPICGISVRATRDVAIGCLDCNGIAMIKEETQDF